MSGSTAAEMGSVANLDQGTGTGGTSARELHHRPLTKWVQLDDQRAATIADGVDGPDARLDKKVRSETTRKCASQVSAVQRQILDLVYFREKTIEEVAYIVGAPVSTVKTRMFYAPGGWKNFGGERRWPPLIAPSLGKRSEQWRSWKPSARRGVREYMPETVDDEALRRLIGAAVEGGGQRTIHVTRRDYPLRCVAAYCESRSHAKWEPEQAHGPG